MLYHGFTYNKKKVFLILLFLVGFAQKKAEAAPESSIYFDPASLSSAVGGTFTLDAKINPGSNLVYGVDAAITFDPSNQIR